MRHLVPHDLSPEQARAVADRAFSTYRERYAKYRPRLNWRSDSRAEASFTAKGMTVRGTIELLPDAIGFELDVPFVFRIFKSRAIAVVEREVRRWCAQARSGSPNADAAP